MVVTAGIFLASILLKEMRYLVYIRYLWLHCTWIAGPQVRFLPGGLYTVASLAWQLLLVRSIKMYKYICVSIFHPIETVSDLYYTITLFYWTRCLPKISWSIYMQCVLVNYILVTDYSHLNHSDQNKIPRALRLETCELVFAINAWMSQKVDFHLQRNISLDFFFELRPTAE
jgi:hypothetical protein